MRCCISPTPCVGQGVSLLLAIAYTRMHVQASWPMGFLRDPLPSRIRSTWITAVCYSTQLLSGFWGDLNSEPHACIESALTTEPPLQQTTPSFS